VTPASQVWELDGALFRRHASPSISAYADETATIMRELDMARLAASSRARSSLALNRSPRLRRACV